MKIRKMGKIIFAGLAAFCFSFAGIVLLEVGAAEQEPLSFAPVFADHMVLQRDAEVSVFGYGAEGEKVIVEYDGRTAEGSVENGKWERPLCPFPASTEGKTLTATSPSGSISVSDVVVGEVWLCSGQSNMELSLQYVGFGEYRSYANVDKIVWQISKMGRVRRLSGVLLLRLNGKRLLLLKNSAEIPLMRWGLRSVFKKVWARIYL